jgi:PAS domain S-box-containing protein
MTAHGDEQKAVDAMKAGAMDYVVKSSTSLLSMPALADNVLKRWDILLEHKKNQKALEKSEYEKSIVLSTISEIISYQDKDFKIVWANDALASALGTELDSLIGCKCYKIWHQRDKPCENCPVQKSFGTGFYQTGEIATPDGRYWFIRANPVKDEQGNVTGVVEVTDDITERKRANEKLLAYQRKLKSLGSQLLLAEEKERRRIAVNIHDDVGQNLALSKLTLQSLEQSVDNERVAASLGDVCSVIDKIIKQTRTLTFDLSSPVLYELGFTAAVESWVTERIDGKYDIKCHFQSAVSDIQLDDQVKIVLFRAVKEALVNVIKHAEAQNLWVEINKVDNEVKVKISDDGIGFRPKKNITFYSESDSKSFGLFNIREKLEFFGGKLVVNSKPNQGTFVVLTAPTKTKTDD